MALQKQPIPINFAQGLDTKTDPFQVSMGKFLTLENSVFTTANRLSKRNGFKKRTTLDELTQTNLMTLNDNLLATGSNLSAYSESTNRWLDKGTVQPVGLEVQSLIRATTSQSQPDIGVSDSGLTLLAYIDSGLVYYQVTNTTTGQQIIPRTLIPNAVSAPRVFVLGRYFVVTFISTITAVQHLQYLAIPIATPQTPGTIEDISTTLPSVDIGYDGVVTNNNLYIGWSDVTDIKLTYLSSTLILQAPSILLGETATLMSLSADESSSTPTIWLAWYDGATQDAFSAAYTSMLVETLGPTATLINEDVVEITSISSDSIQTVFYETYNEYASPYPTTGVQTDFISKFTVTIAGVVSASTEILRSVGLASKAFVSNDIVYMIVTYGEGNQPTYFLIDEDGNIYARLAYSNGGGYIEGQVLPKVNLSNDEYFVPYLIKDFLAPVNKGTDLASGTPVNAIYTQVGVNMMRFTINDSPQYTSEIANVLNLTGGQMWLYDGVRPVEQGFQVWPDNIDGGTSATGGNVGAGTYYYCFTYEWTDNQGLLHRSAPSIPFVLTTTGSTSENTLYVPTLRLTYKVSPNPVRIVGYRWSVAQQTFYQFTSITSPVINDTTVDFVTIIDENSDASILGQTLLYTTGGVIENIAPPAASASTLFKNRLFIVDAENRNLLWYSKQVIEEVPVEMSDLFTIYVAPTTGAQGSTGPVTALSAMDDKLLIFKRDAIYYITGSGPDNTGANSDFSEPIFITSSVGCANPDSIVLMPQGLMFQSDKGIWLLGRDLSTQYIGAPVEGYNSSVVVSALAIPGTNQVRFIIDNYTTLMYDYYFQQWGTFTNTRGISAVLWQGKHTYLNTFGQIYQETPGMYTDGSTPVLMSFTTPWINIAGLQGFERFYFMYLLGTYISPFKINLQLSYDYNANTRHNIIVTPDNSSGKWGDEALWGSGEVWGGTDNVFEARVFPQIQKCEAFQIVINEVFDSSVGDTPGQGLTLSGLNMVIGAKKGYRTQRASKSFG